MKTDPSNPREDDGILEFLSEGACAEKKTEPGELIDCEESAFDDECEALMIDLGEEEPPTVKEQSKRAQTLLHKCYQEDNRKHGFFIEGRSLLSFLNFVDSRVDDERAHSHEIVLSNLKTVKEISGVLSDLTSKCQKAFTHLPHRLNPETGEFEIICGMCTLHCPQTITTKQLRSRGRPCKWDQF